MLNDETASGSYLKNKKTIYFTYRVLHLRTEMSRKFLKGNSDYNSAKVLSFFILLCCMLHRRKSIEIEEERMPISTT